MTPELLKSEADNCDAQSGLSPAPLLGVSDERLIAHVCRWMANQTETGNGSVSANDRRESRARMVRQGKDVSSLPEPKMLTPHDAEYVQRLRDIAKRFETPNENS